MLKSEKLITEAFEDIDNQNWDAAWKKLEQIDHAEIGSLEIDYLTIAATVLKNQSNTTKALDVYKDLQYKISLQDPQISEIFMSQAECMFLSSNYQDAINYAKAALLVPNQDKHVNLKLISSLATIYSTINLNKSLSLFDNLLKTYNISNNSIWSKTLFSYADCFFMLGSYNKALPKLIDAYNISNRSNSMVSLADSLRRIPLTRILLGQSDYAFKGINDLNNAQKLYQTANDKGSYYIHTEKAEIYRAIGRWREAEKEFNKGLWEAREKNDLNRSAHNLLGLFELSRTNNAIRWTYIEEAYETYKEINNQWGLVHSLIAKTLADDKNQSNYHKEFIELTNNSRLAPFNIEKKNMDIIIKLPIEERNKYLHLLNYN